MKKFDVLPDRETIEKTMNSLRENGITPFFANNRDEARKILFEIVPPETEVMTMTSITLQESGIAKEINESGRFNSSRNKLNEMEFSTSAKEMFRLGATSDYTIGSVHAITEGGTLMIASLTGSQLSAYAYSSPNVIWVAGAQKIVKDIEEGMKRIHEYCLPLESDRARKAYGVPGSAVNKVLMINKEIAAGRLRLIIINEVIGF